MSAIESIYIREMREKCGLTQTQLAKKLGFKNGQFISNIERGVCYLPIEKIEKFVLLTGASTEFIVDMKLKAFERNLKNRLKKIL